jgi:hypothetical protein
VGFWRKKSVRRQQCEVYIEHAEPIMEDAKFVTNEYVTYTM